MLQVNLRTRAVKVRLYSTKFSTYTGASNTCSNFTTYNDSTSTVSNYNLITILPVPNLVGIHPYGPVLVVPVLTKFYNCTTIIQYMRTTVLVY